jgi:hypothetical protein
VGTLSLQRSRELLKEQGYDTWIVEKPYNPYTKKRQDLFNCIDLLGIRRDIVGSVGIQACGEDVAAHIKKIIGKGEEGGDFYLPANPYLKTWLEAQNRFFIWSWVKRGAKGKRKTWVLREIEFLIENGQVVHREIPKKETE